MESPRQSSPWPTATGGNRLSFQVPWEVTGRPTVSLVVTRAGESGTAAGVPVVDFQPAIYTTDGTQAVVVHNADYTLAAAGRPLERGEFAFLYATGLGQVANQPPTGSGGPITPLARAVADVRVTLAGLPCEVQYAGLAPGFVGVYQVNLRVPRECAGRIAGSGPERRRRSQSGGEGVRSIGGAIPCPGRAFLS